MKQLTMPWQVEIKGNVSPQIVGPNHSRQDEQSVYDLMLMYMSLTPPTLLPLCTLHSFQPAYRRVQLSSCCVRNKTDKLLERSLQQSYFPLY